MTESPIREKKSVRTLGRIFKTIVSAFCVLCVAGLLLFMTLPITSLPLSEHNPIVTGQRAGAFVGHWETSQQNGTYALFPDGSQADNASLICRKRLAQIDGFAALEEIDRFGNGRTGHQKEGYQPKQQFHDGTCIRWLAGQTAHV